MTNATDHALLRATDTIRALRERVAELERTQASSHEPIAVVSTACRLPGSANSPEEYWELLTAARNAVRPLTGNRWAGIDFSALDDPAFARLAQHAGQIDDVDAFDASFFGIDGAEAELMDPQQRILLEIAWEAAERAGWTAKELETTPTGVFVGVGHQDYMLASLAARTEIGSRLSTGSGARSLLANRLSYEYGLRGPSMAVDTACSSSLVAIHLACQSLRSGGCDRALAGGVNLIVSPLSTTMTGRALPLAPDGRTKALAADADGMVRGEGAGIVTLRRLTDALEDGDPIAAVILADGTNQDGRTNGLTAPSPVAQQALLQRVLSASGLKARDITVVEMHGTGTPLGDPIEYEAIREVYGGRGEQDPICWLGSAKANLGHLESAAGVASLIKALGVVQHGRVPAQINLEKISPFIQLEGERFAVPRRLETWVPARERYAAVSSFGFGGTNAHLIIAHPDAIAECRARRPSAGSAAQQSTPAAVLMPVSARSAPALASQLSRFAAHLEGLEPADVRAATTAAARRREHHPWRAAITAARPELLPAALRRAADTHKAAASRAVTHRRLGFVYSGQAAQWPRMGVALAERDPVVREELLAWDKASAVAGGPPLLATLSGPESEQALRDTRFAQLAIAALQAALTMRLRGWGLVPDAVCGHSVGEVSAAVAAGALSREQAVQVLLARGEALHQHAAGGAMYAVRAPADEVARALAQAQASPAGAGRAVGIAAFNSPQGTVLSGPTQEMEAVRRHLSAWRVTPLVTDYAFHSPGLAPVAQRLRAELGGVRPSPAQIPLYSTVTGTPLQGQELTAEHWGANAAQPVRFSEAVGGMVDDGVTGFVEIGPHPALLPHLQQVIRPGAADAVAVATLRREQDELLGLYGALGQLWVAGYPVDWAAVYPGSCPMVPLPTYPWQHDSHWITGTRKAASDSVPTPPAGLPKLDDEEAVLTRLVAHLSEVMQTDPAVLAPDRSARDLDVDSVSFVELKNRLESDLGVAIPITVLTEGATLRDVARSLADAQGQRGPTSEEARHALDNLDDLSEEELDRLMAALDSDEGR